MDLLLDMILVLCGDGGVRGLRVVNNYLVDRDV